MLLLALAAGGRSAAAQGVEPAGAAPEAAVVLGFENLGREAALDWIGAGIAATLRADLVERGFVVRDPDAGVGMPSAGSLPIDQRGRVALARELGVRWLVSGVYEESGAELRLSVRLTDAAAGSSVVIRFGGALRALFDLQDEVVLELARRMSAAAPPDLPAPAPGASAGRAAAGLGLPPAFAIDGPPPPVAPAVINRDASGRATVRAVRLTSPLSTDGRLDESVYETVPPMSGFIQVEPVEGAPATEETDVWMFYDDDQIHISVRCWDSQPPSEWVLNEMRRDNNSVFDSENIAILLDTFYDRRNGVFFLINAIGGRIDAQVTNERNYNPDWNPVWDLATGQFDGGWTIEASVPFKSLRYRPGRTQVWGIQVRRFVRWKNEYSYLTPIPAGVGLLGTFQSSLAATLVDLEAPESTRTLELKPYATADLVTDRTVKDPIVNSPGGDAGLDVKLGVTRNLTADLTVNTDFAQVEADEQQVNLTRFSLFFPEKREFFLENQGLFAFGGGGSDVFGGGGNTPILFYSREIGLDQGHEVPLDAGARLTGRVGRFSIGAMGARTGESPVSDLPDTTFSVLRLRRDILRRSSIGVIYTGRSASKVGPGRNEVFGADGTFSFYDNLSINTYWARSRTPGLEPRRRDDEMSYRAKLDYAGDRYGVQAERLVVGGDFNPEVGFLLRDDFERSFGLFRFSPRPAGIAAIRKLTWQGQFDYITTRDDVLETRQAQGRFQIEFESSDQFDATFTRSYELLDEPFPIAPGVTIPIGGYSFQDAEVAFAFGPQRMLGGRVSAQHGSFYGGEKTSVGIGRARLKVTPRLSVEPGMSFNWIKLPEGSFSTELVTTRTTYTVTPRMFVGALVQYNSSNNSLGANIRLRWEYQPGSELFVVYNEQRDTLTPRYPELQNRSFVIKINRLLRF